MNVVFMDNDIFVFKSLARIFENEDFDYGCTISDSKAMPVASRCSVLWFPSLPHSLTNRRLCRSFLLPVHRLSDLWTCKCEHRPLPACRARLPFLCVYVPLRLCVSCMGRMFELAQAMAHSSKSLCGCRSTSACSS